MTILRRFAIIKGLQDQPGDGGLPGSSGQVVFDLDVTAQTRPGYFGAMEAGPLFVENRYTDWHRYWPHQTLRNLWKLSRWVDPRRLRMEWLNHTRNTEKYANDPLAPAAWSPDANRVAFTRNGQIYSLNLTGFEERQLTHDPQGTANLNPCFLTARPRIGPTK